MHKTLFFAFLLIQNVLFAQYSERSLSSENWQFKNSKDKNWLPAKVPGTVHLDLMANKLIPDPFKDENEKQVQWVENEDWDYQTSFEISFKEFDYDNIDLVFNGLDTFSEIYLNGRLLKKTDNMFRTWEIPVKEYLKQGTNLLQLKFKSAVNEGTKLAKKIPFTMPESPRSFVRKAQYQFGWDWGPRLVTAGIWKDVKLEFWRNAKVKNIQVQQKYLSDAQAEVSFNMSIFAEEEGEYYTWFNLNRGMHKFHLNKGFNTIILPYKIKEPKKWQPNGRGTPALYTTKISLYKKGGRIIRDINVTYG